MHNGSTIQMDIIERKKQVHSAINQINFRENNMEKRGSLKVYLRGQRLYRKKQILKNKKKLQKNSKDFQMKILEKLVYNEKICHLLQLLLA